MKGDKKANLTSVDDLFSTEESRTDIGREKVMEIALTELFPFKDHPFKVNDDEAMADTAESIKEYGVLVPAIVSYDKSRGNSNHARHRIWIDENNWAAAMYLLPLGKGYPANL